MSNGGYIKLWRQIRKSPVWVDDGALKLWIDLLMRVTTKPRKTVLKIGREPVVVVLEAGQCAVRERLLAQDLHMSRNKLRRLIALLVRLECITTTPSSKCVLITIPNWAKYQQVPVDGGSQIEPPSPNGGSAIEPGSEPPSEPGSEPHNKKTKNTKKSVCHFVPPTPAEVTAYGKSIGYSVDGDRFCDSYAQAGWRLSNGNPMKDWQAAVRNWRNRDKQRNGRTVDPNPDKPLTKAEDLP